MADFAGLLDPQTLQQLRAFMNEMQPTDQEKASARTQALLAAGLATLGARPGGYRQGWGNALEALGQGGLLGVQQYNKDLSLAGAQRGQNMTQALQLMALARQNQQFQDQGAVGNAVVSAYGDTPSAPQNPSSSGPPPVGALGGASVIPPPGITPPSAPVSSPSVSATPP